MRTAVAALIHFTVACSVIWAAPPELTVTQTEVKTPGDILRLTANAKDAKSYVWRVWADIKDTGPTAAQIESIKRQAEAFGLTVTKSDTTDEKTYHLECDGGKSIDLPTWKGQQWVVFSSVSNEKGEQSSAVVCVKVPGGPEPGPTPPEPPSPPPVPPGPQPLPELASKVADAVKPKTAAHAEFRDVADVYESVAAMAAAGALAGPEEVVQLTSSLSKSKLPTHLADWQDVVKTVIGPHLNALSEAGKLETAADHAGPFKEIAAGIRAGIK